MSFSSLINYTILETIKRIRLYSKLSLTLTLIIFIISSFLSILSKNILNLGEPLNTILWWVCFLLSIFIYYPITKLALLSDQTKKVNFLELTPSLSQSVKYFLVNFLIILLTMLGLILLIVPGLYWATKYFFVSIALVDKNTSIGESFSESAKITEGKKWKLFPIFLLSFIPAITLGFTYNILPDVLVDIVGAAFGFFATFATAVLYLRLKKS